MYICMFILHKISEYEKRDHNIVNHRYIQLARGFAALFG